MDNGSITGYGLDGAGMTPTAAASLPLLNIGIVISVILCLIFTVLAFFGYGTLRLENLPTDSTVRVNNHVTTGQSLKLRPGSYKVVITSPLSDPYFATVHITAFGSATVKPSSGLRNPDAIASSVLGAVNAAIPVHVLQPKWFDNNTWLVGFLSPGNPKMALHYDTKQKQWTVGYYEMTGYPADAATLPTDVAAYIKQLGAQYHAG